MYIFARFINERGKFVFQFDSLGDCVQMRICCFGESIGVHVDAGKSHHADCILVFLEKMLSPGRVRRNIHDVEHINKYKRFLTGIVKRPCRMLFKKWLTGGVYSTVCCWVHPQRFCLCNFCFNCTAGDFLAHHIMVILLRSHKRIVAVRPVIELYQIDMAFQQPFQCAVISVSFCKVA